MVLDLIKEIGDYIKAENPFFDNYAINGVKTSDGRVIQFTDNRDKKYIGITDCEGNYFYIRFDPNITFSEPARRLTSCQKTFNATAKCRIVALSFSNVVSSDKLTDRLIRGLKEFKSTNVMARPQIVLTKQNFHYIDVFKEEVRERISEGMEFTGVYIDFDLIWGQDDAICLPCELDIEREC
jgi:hypothetical protein